jgi:hypothetical protein
LGRQVFPSFDAARFLLSSEGGVFEDSFGPVCIFLWLANFDFARHLDDLLVA